MFGTSQRPENDGIAQIKVIGVGGGGCNAVNRMYIERVPGVEDIIDQEDVAALERGE